MGVRRRLALEFVLVFLISWLLEYLYMGIRGLIEGTLVSFLEISLSFDNAVMNAVVLSGMTALWRKRFITWGMVVAVFGVRFLFPLIVVSWTSGMGLVDAFTISVSSPELYSKLLVESEEVIVSFGGAFLFMVFLNWLFDAFRDDHWIRFLEERASSIARLGEVKLIIGLGVVFLIGILKKDYRILLAMVCGLLLFEVINFIRKSVGRFDFSSDFNSGLVNFLYLELLDASCSLDGTVSAFAVSNNLVIITIGLSVGAFILRSLTVYFVSSDKLGKLPYIEHGAHWGIGGLGILMILQLFFSIPEVLVSFIAFSFIASSLYSSVSRVKSKI